MSPVFKIAARNLRKNWRHSLASILAITTACLAICTFQGFYIDASSVAWNAFSVPGMLGHVTIQKEGAGKGLKADPLKFGLTADDQAFINSFLDGEAERLEARVRWLNVAGMVSNGRTNTVFVGYGFDLDEGVKIRGKDWAWNALYGKPLQSATESNPVAIGLGLGAIMDCDPEGDGEIFTKGGSPIPEERPFRCYTNKVQLQTVTSDSQLNAMDATLVSMVDSGLRELEDKYMIMPLQTAQELMNTQELSMYTVRLKDDRDIDGFLSRLKTAAAAKNIRIEADRWEAHPTLGEFYRRAIAQVALLRVVMIAVLVLIGTMSVINTVLKNVTERTREIGTMRSMGYLRPHIATLFAAEGFMLAVVACALGLVGTVVISGVVGLAGLYYPPGVASYPLPLHIPIVPGAYVLVTLGLCVVSTIAALVPALRAARMRITDALGHL